MKHFRSLLAGLAAALCWIWFAQMANAVDVKIIANPSVKVAEASLEELRSIFLRTRTSLADEGHIEAVLLRSGATHEAFVEHFIGKSEAGLESHYRNLVFTGKGLIPKTFASEAEVVNFVAKTKGTIGYVSTNVDVTGVRTLRVK